MPFSPNATVMATRLSRSSRRLAMLSSTRRTSVAAFRSPRSPSTWTRQAPAYVAGETMSWDFPTVNPIQANRNGQNDSFIVKLDAAGGIVYSTLFGGSSGGLRKGNRRRRNGPGACRGFDVVG